MKAIASSASSPSTTSSTSSPRKPRRTSAAWVASAGMGGNAGTQTMTVVVRALATPELGRANALRIIGRELMVGVLNGLAFALIMGVIASAWFNISDLGLVIGLAMVTVPAAD